MRILLFAEARRAAGVAEFELAGAGGLSAAQVWRAVCEQYPALTPYQAVARLARNGEYAGVAEVFGPADEVAVIPPVSGG